MGEEGDRKGLDARGGEGGREGERRLGVGRAGRSGVGRRGIGKGAPG